MGDKEDWDWELMTYLQLEGKKRRQWRPTPVLLPGKSHGWRSLVGCSPWGLWESDTTEQLHFHFSLSCIGEGNGNALQYSCLENPRDRGAWWAAVYGVAQSCTQLKQLSSSSSSRGKKVSWYMMSARTASIGFSYQLPHMCCRVHRSIFKPQLHHLSDLE